MNPPTEQVCAVAKCDVSRYTISRLDGAKRRRIHAWLDREQTDLNRRILENADTSKEFGITAVQDLTQARHDYFEAIAGQSPRTGTEHDALLFKILLTFTWA